MSLNKTCAALALTVLTSAVHADENLFGYIRGAEVLPKGASEFYQWFTQRSDKGQGTYRAIDSKTEFEYGLTDRFQVSAELNAMSLKTSGLVIDGYLPSDKKFGLRLQGVELGMKYNFLSPAKDDFGLSGLASFEYGVLDVHSGQKKTEYEVETQLQAQKYFMEGQLVWVGNVGLRAAYEQRKAIDNLPAGFDWPTDPEMEISTKIGTGLSYRFQPNWYIGAELLHETEFETEVGQERWSLFGGPTLHYGGDKWWASLTYFKQLRGGGEKYVGQADDGLHLIEKTKQEIRLKVGYNF
ncbi:MAG: hypothetical protein EOP38_12060 [Rubrivivax sp.]|nr:MAG: hypothetical protein EOP38_12060 [Rubrivivax sp.]